MKVARVPGLRDGLELAGVGLTLDTNLMLIAKAALIARLPTEAATIAG